MFTTYNEQENRFQSVEEPDPSLNYTFADYLQWKFEETSGNDLMIDF